MGVSRRNSPYLVACIAAVALAWPFGALAGVAVHVLSAIVIVFFAVGRERPVTDRLVAFAVTVFAIGQIVHLHVAAEAKPLFLPGYVALIAVGVIFLRERVRRMEQEIKADAALAAALVTFVLVLYQETLPAGRQFPLTTAAATVLVAIFLLGVVGRAHDARSRLFALATVLALVLGTVESAIPTDNYALLFTLPNIPLIVHMTRTEPAEDVAPAPLSATRPFGWIHSITLFLLLSILPLTVLLMGRDPSANIQPLAVISIVIAAVIVSRVRMMFAMRDWSIDQELILRAFGNGILGVDDRELLNRKASETVLQLAGGEGSAAVIAVDDGEFRVLSQTASAQPTRGRAMGDTRFHHLGDRSPAVDQWLSTVTTGPTTVAVRVPGLEEERYLVATGPQISRADVAGNIQSAAIKYGLATAGADLADALRRSMADNVFNLLAQDANDVVLVADPDTLQITFVAPTGQKLMRLGADRNLIGVELLSGVCPNDHDRFSQMIDDAKTTGRPAIGDVRLILGDGTMHWFDISIRDLTHEPDVGGLLITSSDVHDRKTSELEVANSERRFRAMVQNSRDVSLLIDETGLICYASPNVKARFGFDESALTGSMITDLLRPGNANDLRRACNQVLDDGHAAALEIQLLPGPSIGADELTVEAMISDAKLGTSARLVVLLRDITVWRQMENSLRSHAMFDETTGLLNRATFVHSLHAQLKSLPPKATLMVGVIDLENYRAITRQEGYAAGDRMCVEMAARLTSGVRKDDLLARLSADQLGFVCRVDSYEDGIAMADRLRTDLGGSFQIGGLDRTPDLALGVTFTSDRRSVPQALIQQAGMSAAHGDARRKSTPVVFQPCMMDEANERFQISQDLRYAARSDQFDLVYQPLVRAGDGYLTAFEALLRWKHPERGNISPGLFVPLAEKSGAIVDIGRWVMERSCDRLAQWQQSGKPIAHAGLDVNVSPIQFEQEGELDRLIETMVNSGIDPGCLTVELTESVIVSDTCSLQDQLRRLRDIGVTIAIDDFGSGAAGFAHLRDFTFDLLKIDKSYIDPLVSSEETRMLVRGIIDLAHDLGALVTAEGVEHAEQLGILTDLGCDLIQGYYFARPMNETELDQWMHDRPVTRLDFPSARQRA